MRQSGPMMTWLGRLAAVALSATFIYAAAVKIHDPAGFAKDLTNYRLFPWWSINAIALAAPWWELFAGVVLLIPAWRRCGAVMTLGMGIIFFASVAQALYRGLDISCGCFGHGESARKAGLTTLAIDIGVIAGSLLVLRLREKVDQRRASATSASVLTSMSQGFESAVS